MHLKRLLLYGFKTFADRTELEFGPGVTAIVGPNGSGKSNLADALVWVLGEQSLKSLRGSRSQDIIFAGADRRRPVGVAEVTVELDNADGALSLDFEEVTVTRRVFRSGEGEYFINRVPCRLRDVQELFLDTGLGKQAYSLINQNEIDAILSIRSEDRRALFEEAAGVHKYRHRKREAERKLETTRQNLIRVTDVIGELEGQLDPLAHQSEQAQEFKQLSAELNELRLGLLASELEGQRSALARAREREERLSNELEAARAALSRQEAEELRLRGELEEAEERLEQKRALAAAMAAELEKGEGAHAVGQERLRSLEEQREGIAREIAELQDQLDHSRQALSCAESQQQALAASVDQLRAGLAELEAEIGRHREALSGADQQHQLLRSQYLEVMAGLAEARNELSRGQSLVRMAESSLGRIRQRRRELEEQRSELAGAQQQAGERERLAGEKLAQLQAGLTDQEARLKQASGEQESARRESTQLQGKLSSTKARLSALKEMEESGEGFYPGVRAVLAAIRSGEIKGKFVTVSDLLRVPARLEVAVGTALGPDLQSLVVRTEDQARQAIEYLKRKRAGRATFLPLDRIQPRPRPDLDAGDSQGCLGLAADLVGYSPEHRQAVDFLLAGVVITRNLEAALAISRRESGWRKMVSLDGQVVFPAGRITGGSPEAGHRLLARRREIEELGELVAATEQELSACQRRAESAAEAIAAASRELERLRSEQMAVSTEMAQTAAAGRAAGEQLSRAELETASLEEECRQLEADLSGSRQEQAQAEQSVEQFEQNQAGLEQQMQGAEQSLRERRGQAESLSDRVVQARLAMGAAEGDLRAQRAEAERARAAGCDLEGALAARQRALSELDARRGDLCQRMGEGQAGLERLRQQCRAAEEQLESARSARQTLLDSRAAALESARVRREEIEDWQGRLHRGQLRSAQLESEIGFLERNLLEDFRLTPDQAIKRSPKLADLEQARARVDELRARVEELGAVNLGAIEEHRRIAERLDFLTGERADLEQARASLAEVIAQADQESQQRLLDAFHAIGREFEAIFQRFFAGGSTELSFTSPDQPLESGIDVQVTLPGKRAQNLLLLSGGERALTALALVFALLRLRPAPFVVLDEIDAPLDETNVERYREVLREFAQTSQFIVITHNRGTMEAADTLYGVTMEQPGVSRLISVRLAELPAEAGAPM